jgi:hypothetical protein
VKADEFEAGWTVLQAMLQFPVSDAARAAYSVALSGLPDGAFAAAVRSLVASPDWDPKTLPTVAEVREEALSIQAGAKRGRPYIAGTNIPLSAVLDGTADLGAVDADPNVGRASAAVVLGGAAQPRALGPGSMGHALALRAAGDQDEARARAARKAPELTPDEWERRRAELLRQGDELLGPDEAEAAKAATGGRNG